MTRFGIYDLLHQGLMEMNIDGEISEQAVSQLIREYILIAQWNRVYNLSSILDVGTGAGLPGIPLAIAMPDRQFVFLDSNQKKIKFLQQIFYQMRLENVRIMHQRVEDYRAAPLFDSVISGAFGTLRDFLFLSQHLIKSGRQMLAMKGVYPLTELQEIDVPFKLVEAEPLDVPGLNAECHVVELIYEPEMQQDIVGV